MLFPGKRYLTKKTFSEMYLLSKTFLYFEFAISWIENQIAWVWLSFWFSYVMGPVHSSLPFSECQFPHL